VVSVESGPAEAAVAMRYQIKGQYQDRKQPRLAGLVFEKRISLKAESDAVVCDVSLSNPTGATKLVTYWNQQYFFAGGTTIKIRTCSLGPAAGASAASGG